MQAKLDRTSRLWLSVAQLLFGCIGLALLTFVCFRVGLDTDTTGFAYLILIALLSLMGSFIGSAVLSIIAVVCLNYFFAEPQFSFQVRNPDDILAMAGFVTTSFIVCALTAKMRWQAEQAQTSQQLLVDTIPAMVWSASPDGLRDFHNQRWLDFTGLPAEEGRGQGWAAVIHPDDRAAIIEEWRSAVTTGGSFEAEARARGASGEYRWFLARAEPLRDESGSIVKWYGTSTDIEDRKRATDALRESEQQWKEVFEHNPVMYFMVDPAGTVLSVNNFGATQLGYTVDELVGQSVLIVFFEEDRDTVQKSVAVCLNEIGRSQSWEIRKVRKDGTVLWVRENAKALQRFDNQLIVLIACEDITERKRSDDELRLREAYMAHAQQLAGVGSWAYSNSSIVEGRYWDKCEHWSDELWRITDFDPTAGPPPPELIVARIHPDDHQRMEESNRQVLAGRRMNIKYRFFRADGELRFFHSIGALVYEGGVATRLLGATRDITEEEKRTEELREVQAELAHANRVATMGQLTAAIAHEVNQPITAAVTNAQAALRWMSAEPPDFGEVSEALAGIIKEGNRASEVIGRTRALIKKAPPRKDAVSINDAIVEVVALTRTEAANNGVLVRTQLAESLPPVQGDRVQLQQVLLNLIINAIEAMRDVGEEERELLISTRNEPDGVSVEVRDSGPGFTPAALERVFEAFYTTKPSGLGLGLSICRSIVEAHGGQLWANANAPQGATFQFTIPVEEGRSKKGV